MSNYSASLVTSYKPLQRLCVRCGRPVVMASYRKYCGPLCSALAKKESDRLRDYRSHEREDRECKVCGTVMKDLAKTSHQKYCSRKCSKKAHPSYRYETFESKRRRENRRRERLGLPLLTGAKKERKQLNLWEQNAKQAWRYWYEVKAPDEWMARYWAHAPWFNPRITRSESYRLRYSLDNEFAVKERIRNQINKQRKLARLDFLARSALERCGSSPVYEQVVGYTISELAVHLEKQFTKGMSWDRFRAGEIHIDHIIPKTDFDLTSEDEVRVCWSLGNLRPLWAKDNISKYNRRLTLL